MNRYFSDREKGETPRIEEKISPTAWSGLVARINALLESNAFAYRFPLMCPDGNSVCDTDKAALNRVLASEMHGLSFPLPTETGATESSTPSWSARSEQEPYAPDTLLILDLLEFVHSTIAQPINDGFHSYFRHYHLEFDQPAGQAQFREDVNRIFQRNALAFEFSGNGQIRRTKPQGLEEILQTTQFKTGDNTLNEMLNESIAKHANPDPRVRREAVERLWDAWERLKSIDDPKNKKRSAGKMLDITAGSDAKFRDLLEKEAIELTTIGNSFHIRHTETTQTRLEDSTHLEYLFHRLLSLVLMILKKSHTHSES